MENNFFYGLDDSKSIRLRIEQLEHANIGFYSIGLYPASLAYNSVMQCSGVNLFLAPRPNRDLLGAFSREALSGMDKTHLKTLSKLSIHQENNHKVTNTLEYLIKTCDLLVLCANSNHIQSDLLQAINLRITCNRPNLVIACLAGSFCHDDQSNQSYVLCENYPNLGFFSGFHRHGALRNPFDSFTANFCHPNGLTAMFAARILDKLSPNIQVSAGVHNIEGQYIKAAKNISSILAGFGYRFHSNNSGLLPTLLTLLLNQCLDQAATVSMSRPDRKYIYNSQPFPITELGYGVQRIQASLTREGDTEIVRDHTFSQLTAMVADVRGSMNKPTTGSPTRNFLAGELLADFMKTHKRCPDDVDEFKSIIQKNKLSMGALEGIKSLKYWPQIRNHYSIPIHDSSMINLLYMTLFGSSLQKSIVYRVLTDSRELTNYCQESVRPKHSRGIADAMSKINDKKSMNKIINVIIDDFNLLKNEQQVSTDFNSKIDSDKPAYSLALSMIEKDLPNVRQ